MEEPPDPLFQPNGDTFYLFEAADEKKIKGNYKTMVKDGQDFVRNDYNIHFLVVHIIILFFIFPRLVFLADGFRWKQEGTFKINHEDEGEIWPCKKVYYKTVLPDQSLTAAFKRNAFYHSKFPLRVLVVYQGDSSVQVPRPHGKLFVEHYANCVLY